MCFPHWQSPGIFSSLIGGAGAYVVRPHGRFVWGGYYEERSLIWRSRWITADNVAVECREALALPASPGVAVVLRRVTALNGDAAVDVALAPRGDYGQAPMRLATGDGGCWCGETAGVRFRWTGADGARLEERGTLGPALVTTLQLPAGKTRDLVLVLGDDGALVDPAETWRRTEADWRRRVPQLPGAAGRRDAEHAVAVLAGLTSAGKGMVAAATTALPEHADRGRNYDYRYAWIRDQCYAGRAAGKAGVFEPLDSAVEFVSARLLEDGPLLAPAYTANGERVPGQRRLALPGYPGAEARIGNHAGRQFQLDAFGEALLLLAEAASHDRLEAHGWQAAAVAASSISERWCEDDAGIWETKPRRWTHSRLIAAAGLRAAAALAPDQTALGWSRLADTIVGHVSATSLHPSGRWQRAADDQRVDAALLLAPLRGAIPAEDPRSIATLAAYLDELTDDGYAYRYRVDDAPLGEAEGAFLLCGFVVALAHRQRGNTVEAFRWFERNRAACGPPGLLSEEFDIRERQLRGNLPQAFVHALLLETAVELVR